MADAIAIFDGPPKKSRGRPKVDPATRPVVVKTTLLPEDYRAFEARCREEGWAEHAGARTLIMRALAADL